MKFWKKIFIYSMTLFLIIFNGAGIFIIENIHERSLNRTIKAAIDEHKVIEGTIYLNTDSTYNKLPTSQGQLKDWLTLVITGYISNDSVAQDGLELYDAHNNLLFSRLNQTVPLTRDEINNAKLNERFFIIKKTNKNYYLFISSKFILENNTIKLVLTKNIDSIYQERSQNYNLFFMLDGVIFILLAFGMYLIVKNATTPIVKLSEASKEIAYGNYSKRVVTKNKNDEVSVLAKNFNIMAQATEDKIEELKDLNNAKQRFIDSLTHELKTPLTSIIGYSDLLIKGNINDNIRFTAVNYINSESKRLEKLSTTLLKLILINQENLSVENFSLKDCIINSYTSLSYKIGDKNLKVKFDINDIKITGDKQLIIVLFINILENAIKASNNNGVIEIKGVFLENSSTYQLSFKDYGVGIPKEDLNKIREPFYMVDKARDRAKSGMGLGLAICEKICTMHNLKLHIDSEPEKGTEVFINFFKESIVS
ncbi:HAMP domain-containing sensor histidine kinase [Clostridium sp. MB40-C1]|uniref:sensor histidine kinase n=1 Tax=Clostridium sp. MB40-C1 TaxID=3070996 RepID=UPI0027E20E4F|nr:HAMP domain-containing sensor histidine kinase [Clostridium sp. MB40-C1]WMJ81690.1 HAMP domain-containing sensor histidine kinase [Clostridium sp. MB40-C1]